MRVGIYNLPSVEITSYQRVCNQELDELRFWPISFSSAI